MHPKDNPHFLENRMINQDWQRAMLRGEDPFGILTAHPNREALGTVSDNLSSTPLHYFCLTATLEQIQHAMEVIPFSSWNEIIDQNGQSPIHFLAQFNPSVFIALLHSCQAEFQPLFFKTDKGGNNCLLHLAASGNKAAIQYVLSDAFPDAFKAMRLEKDKIGNNFFHNIAWSGNVDAIRYVLSDDIPEAFKAMRLEKNKNGGNFFHDIAWSGNVDAIRYALSDAIPDAFKAMRLEKNKRGENFFHYIVKSGSVDAIRYALSDEVPDSFKAMRLEKDKDGENFWIHIVTSADVNTIRYALSDEIPDSFKAMRLEKDKGGNNFFHIIAWRGNVNAIRYVLSDEVPEAFKVMRLEKDIEGSNFFHLIMRSGNIDAIRYALSDEVPHDFRAMRLEKDKFGRNFFQDIAFSGKIDAIRYALSDEVPDAFKAMRLEKDKNGANFFHDMALSGNIDAMQFFISDYPELAVTLWVRDKNGDTPDSLAIQRKALKTPSQLVVEKVTEIINKIADDPNALSTKDKKFLIVFKPDIFNLLKNDQFISDDVKIKLFQSSVLSNIYDEATHQRLKIIFSLSRFKKKNLPELLSSIPDLIATIDSMPKKEKFSFFQRETELDKLIVKLIDIHRYMKQPGDINHIARILKLLFSDTRYADSMSDDQKHIFFELRSIIMNTDEISSLMPRPVEKREGELPEAEFARKLDEVKTEIEKSVLSIVNKTEAQLVLSGMKTLSTDFEKMNAFAKSHPHALYFLDEPEQRVNESDRGKLPFHLGNYGVDDALKQTLLRAVMEYIAAFDIAKEAGQLTKFFDITIAGNCLDGRTRDLLTWATQFTGLKSLHELMGDYVKEYQSFRCIFEGARDENAPIEIKPFAQFVMQYHGGEHYKSTDDFPAGSINEAVIQKYAKEILCCEEARRFRFWT